MSKLKDLLIVSHASLPSTFHLLKKTKQKKTNTAFMFKKNVIVAWRPDAPIRGVAQIAYFWTEHYIFWVDKCVQDGPKLECTTMNS